jgi:pSer/pThr/pTyr-binding forkhead associated (FHA) protein
MARGFSDFARLYLADRANFAQRLSVPVLFWEAAEALNPPQEQWNRTESGVSARGARPRPGEPLVFELRKVTTKKNPFSMGVTLGRVDTNDIVIDDASISRFHAWFQNDPKLGWVAVDAESKNGSTVNGARIAPNKKTALVDGTRLRFGDIDVTFLLPESLVRRIEAAFR